MAIYIIFFLLFFCCAILEVGGLKKHQARWLLNGLAVVLILFVGLRYHTGADWYLYHQIFDQAYLGAHRTEYGYVFLNRIFSIFFNSYYVLQFVITLFITVVFARFYKNHSEFPVFSFSILVFLLFFSIFMAQVRQSIALAVVVLAAPYIFDRKILPFLFLIFIASTFHITAVVAIPLYFLYKNYGKVLPLILMVGSQIFYFNAELISSMLLFAIPFLPDRLAFLVESYMGSLFGQPKEFGTGLLYLAQMALSIFLFLFITPKDRITSFFLNSLAVLVIIRGFAIGMEILTRFEPYYLIFAVVAYTYILKIRLKRLKSLTVVVACFMLLFFALSQTRVLVDTSTSPLTGRAVNYPLVPYYNVLFHPPEASNRRDWNER